MASLVVDAPETTVPNCELLRRVMGEFNEMPSLRLTCVQAMRLWALDSVTCEAVLRALVETKFLQQDRSGQFLKRHADY